MVNLGRNQKRKGIAVIVGVLLLILIAIVAAVLLYEFYVVPSQNQNPNTILEDLKIVNLDVNTTVSQGNFTVYLSLLNTGEVALNISQIYVQNLSDGWFFSVSPCNDVPLTPGQDFTIPDNISQAYLNEFMNYSLLFKVVTQRGYVATLEYVPPNNLSSSSSTTGGQGGSSYTPFNITGTKFWDPNFVGGSGNGTPIGSGSYTFLFELFSQDHSPIGWTTNDANGNFDFTGLNKGVYTVTEVPLTTPSGYVWVSTTNSTLTAAINSQSVSLNFTNALSPTIFSIGGQVFFNQSAYYNTTGLPNIGLGNWSVVAISHSSGYISVGETDQNGYYTIGNLSDGWYTVEEILNSTQWINVGPYYQVAFINSSSVNGVNFGNEPFPSGPLPYNMSGIVYNDTSYSGFYNPSDPGLVNWLVTITNGSGLLYGTLTDSQGNYTFPVGNGTYTVQEILLNENWTASSGVTRTVTVSGASVYNVNFGNFYTPVGGPLSISGRIFDNIEMDGIYHSDDQNLTWLVSLKDSSGVTILALNISNPANGMYSLSVPGPGTYTVVASSLPGWLNSTPIVQQVTLTSAPVFGVNFGLYEQTSPVINALVYNDTNPYDGAYNSTVDLPLPGWLVTVRNSTFSETMPTDPSGYSMFTDLAPGVYTVNQLPVVGWTNTTVLSDVVNITSASANVYFGNTLSSNIRYYTLSGMVFNDFDRDGLYDGIDSAYSGVVPITLYSSTGSVLATTDYPGSGSYAFSNVQPGNYIVGAASIPGYAFTNDTSYTYVGSSLQNVSVTITSSGATVNFGVYNTASQPLYTISGNVFNDTSGTGVYNGSQAPLSGWTIFLNPSNQGGGLNFSAPPLETTTTSSSGSYSFPGLAPGNYTVTELVNLPWINTTPAAINVMLIKDTVQNFGDQLLSGGGGQTYSVSGVVFNDINQDHVYDIGDGNLTGWKVYLLDSYGLPIAVTTTSTTSPTGQYMFSDLAAGQYTVQEFLQSGYTNDTPISVGFSIVNSNVMVNFGNVVIGAKPTYVLFGGVFNDSNGNHIYTPSEGLASWTVFLYDGTFSGSNFPSSITTTSATGNYSFTGLSNGTYTLIELLQSGWTNTTPRVVTVTISGSSIETDFGNKPVTGGGSGSGSVTTYTISGIVFNAKDHLGTYDSGDTLLSGWAVYLLDASGIPIAYKSTNSNGQYSFTVSNGTYTPYLDVQSGWTNSSPEAVTVQVAGSSVQVNFGVYKISSAPTYTISGYVFNDSNQNGIFDNGEAGLGSWSVFLYNGVYGGGSSSFPSQITSTNGSGFYQFSSLSPGNYTIVETLKSGWTNTTARLQVVTITSSSASAINFGNYPVQLVTTYSISGMKFDAKDHTGVYNATIDSVISGWTFFISGPNGIPLGETSTNSNGNYQFSGLPNGTYTIYENLNQVVSLGGPWSNSTPASQTVTIAGSNQQGVNFGNYLRGSVPEYAVSGYSFYDANNNSVYDAGDSPVSGLTAYLVGVSNSYWAQTVTNGSGYYDFENAPAGTYIVECFDSSLAATTPSAYQITIINQSSGPWNFGFINIVQPPTLTISGKVFNDTNGNGIYAAGDKNLSGWAVALINPSGNPSVQFTDANGNYSFVVSAGSWTVEVPPQQGWSNTTNWIVPVTISGSSAVVNFGDNVSVPKQQYSISVFVFNDTDRNGIFNGNDVPLSSWIVNLTTPSGANVWSLTNSSGWAVFNNLTAGNYAVQEIPSQMNWLNTTASTVSVTLGPSTMVMFGLYYNPPSSTYSISGMVYNATSSNHLPLANFPVLLIPSSGQPVGMYTDANGMYAFIGLPAGNYTVQALPLPGWNMTPPTQSVTITNSPVSNVNFGSYMIWFNISGHVFLDTAQSGAYNPGSDYPLPGWIVDLRSQSGDTYHTTDSNGFFQYTNVPTGTYTISVVMPPQGWTNTSQTSQSMTLSSDTTQNFGMTRNFTSAFINSYTASQWSANTGGYLKTDFSNVYPGNVIQTGEASPGFSVTFGSPNFANSNLTHYLACPSGTPSVVLDQNYLEPINYPGGMLGADVMALRLNLDYSNAGIGSFSSNFGNLTLYNYNSADGPLLDNCTVSQILQTANQILGGTMPVPQGYSINDYDALVSLINQAFQPGSDYSWANGHLF